MNKFNHMHAQLRDTLAENGELHLVVRALVAKLGGNVVINREEIKAAQALELGRCDEIDGMTLIAEAPKPEEKPVIAEHQPVIALPSGGVK